jgi:hypothetical protein
MRYLIPIATLVGACATAPLPTAKYLGEPTYFTPTEVDNMWIEGVTETGDNYISTGCARNRSISLSNSHAAARARVGIARIIGKSHSTWNKETSGNSTRFRKQFTQATLVGSEVTARRQYPNGTICVKVTQPK